MPILRLSQESLWQMGTGAWASRRSRKRAGRPRSKERVKHISVQDPKAGSLDQCGGITGDAENNRRSAQATMRQFIVIIE